MDYTEKTRQTLDALEAACLEHREEQEKTSKEASLQDILRDWVGAGVKQKQGDIYQQWQEKIAALVAELCTAIEEGPSGERNDAALAGVEPLLFYPKATKDPSGDVLYIALEGLARPLLSFMDRATVAKLADRYRERNPKRKMMPNQKELFRVMERMSK